MVSLARSDGSDVGAGVDAEDEVDGGEKVRFGRLHYGSNVGGEGCENRDESQERRSVTPTGADTTSALERSEAQEGRDS